MRWIPKRSSGRFAHYGSMCRVQRWSHGLGQIWPSGSVDDATGTFVLSQTQSDPCDFPCRDDFQPEPDEQNPQEIDQHSRHRTIFHDVKARQFSRSMEEGIDTGSARPPGAEDLRAVGNVTKPRCLPEVRGFCGTDWQALLLSSDESESDPAASCTGGPMPLQAGRLAEVPPLRRQMP